MVFCFVHKPLAAQKNNKKQTGKWLTYWNGKNKTKTDPLTLLPSVHISKDIDRFQWELTNIYDGQNKTSSNEGVPVYHYNPLTRNLSFFRLFPIGSQLQVEKIIAKGAFHYYGVKIEGEPSDEIVWVSGAYIKKTLKK